MPSRSIPDIQIVSVRAKLNAPVAAPAVSTHYSAAGGDPSKSASCNIYLTQEEQQEFKSLAREVSAKDMNYLHNKGKKGLANMAA